MSLKNKISSNLMLAPMAGVTDKPFRQMVRLFGNHILWTEMIAASALVRGSKPTKKMMDLSNENGPIVIQLVGNNPDEMAQAAQMAEDAGAYWIDINMGCPVKKLISNMSGSALMGNADLACQIVEKVKSSISLPLTVKTRLGLTAQSINVSDFAKSLENAGADGIIIHGRTKEQGYSGHADWDTIGNVKKQASVPVFANGDIVSQETLADCQSKTIADGFLIGRGMLGRPWLLSLLDGNNRTFDVAQIILNHYHLLLEYYGKKGLFVARKHLMWYASGYEGVADFRRKLCTETDEREVKKMIKEFFGGR